MQLVDLTRPLDPADIEKMPAEMRPAARHMIPEIEYIRPQVEGVQAMCRHFGCDQRHLPGGEGWGDETLHMSTHMGTHVDAPLHYGSTCEGRPARTITDIGLQELFVDGFVLDLRGLCEPGKGIPLAALRKALGALGAPPTPGCALILRTGQEAHELGSAGFFNYPGMTREGTLFLAATGAKILCTDALGWDRPFQVMRRVFEETGDATQIWDGHFAGRDREIFIVQQIHNLAALPPHGFKVGFFPLRLAGCSASPARVVGFLPQG